MRRAAKVDLNQRGIVLALRAAGFTVRHTHTIGQGFPDLVVGCWNKNLLVEVKQAGEKLTEDEREFFETWKGRVIIATCAEDVIAEFLVYETDGHHGT